MRGHLLLMVTSLNKTGKFYKSLLRKRHFIRKGVSNYIEVEENQSRHKIQYYNRYSSGEWSMLSYLC